jgi:hypothetical protein
MAGALLMAMAISSCEEDTLTIGNSLTNEADKLDVSTMTYKATTRTIVADSVLSSAASCYLGRIIDPSTKSEVKSEFTTQLHLMEDLRISNEEYITSKADDGRVMADSCDFIFFLKSPFKSSDSLSAMKMRIRELTTTVDATRKYYSNYDPSPLLRNDGKGIDRSHVFTFQNMTDKDSLRSTSSYLQNIRVPFDMPYTSKDNITYENFGTYFLRQFMDHKEKFANPYIFIRDICPGFFIEITDGLGFHSEVTNMALRFFYNVSLPDTAYRASVSLAATKEVLQTVKLTNDKQALAHLAEETQHTYLKTPAGLFTEVTMPVDEIWNEHANDSLLAAKITFQRLNNESDDDRQFGIPATILMVQKDSLYSFFENNRVTDNRTSYYSNYNSSYNVYTFTNISNLITAMRNLKQQGTATDPNWVAAHPDWNKVVLVPITYTTSSTSTTPIKIKHDMSLTSTRLAGGDTPVEMSIVYAKFKK